MTSGLDLWHARKAVVDAAPARDYFPARRVTPPPPDAPTMVVAVHHILVEGGSCPLPVGDSPPPVVLHPSRGATGGGAWLDAVTDWCAWFDDAETEEAWT